MTQTATKQFKRVGAVTVPTLSFKSRDRVFVKILEPIHLGKQLKETTGKEAQKPAHICRVVDLEDGSIKDLICPAVMVSTFAEGDEKDYIGKCFEIIATKKEGKSYKIVEIHLIDDPTK